MTEAEQATPGIDAATPSPARRYHGHLGGTNSFAVGRETAELSWFSLPGRTDAAWPDRGCHQRAARWMSAESGSRQFIDLGSGLPTQGSTHEAVTQVAPDPRIVCAGNDPMALAAAKALLTGVTFAGKWVPGTPARRERTVPGCATAAWPGGGDAALAAAVRGPGRRSYDRA